MIVFHSICLFRHSVLIILQRNLYGLVWLSLPRNSLRGSTCLYLNLIEMSWKRGRQSFACITAKAKNFVVCSKIFGNFLAIILFVKPGSILVVWMGRSNRIGLKWVLDSFACFTVLVFPWFGWNFKFQTIWLHFDPTGVGWIPTIFFCPDFWFELI